MSVDEIIHTCSNEKVAEAAVASIGFVFALRVKNTADVHGLSLGAFAARIVHDFGSGADEHERRVVWDTMERSQHPILCGLRTILERKLDVDSTFDDAEGPLSGWSVRTPEFEAHGSSCCL